MYLHLYSQFFKCQLKNKMEFRTDFLIGILSVLIVQSTSILLMKFVFDHIHSIKGWTFQEIMLIYGVAAMGRAIHHVFFDNLWTLGSQYIRPGNFDRLLIRPINPLFHLIAERVQLDGIGQMVMGIIMLSYSLSNLDLSWGFLEVTILLVMIVSSGLIFAAVNLFVATFSFWMVDSLPIMTAVFHLSDYARYPISIFNKWIQLLLTWIIPYGFVAFYPATVLLKSSDFQYIGLLSPLVAIFLCGFAYLFWLVGLRSFTSTGS
ncbi:ABC transporter permease [Paenibacillus sp. MMS18-CY102]|uniref:ABC transporter permease n=1 Tax=Paenibacillus sp. MMS18-CY102 TaxID=2682849 RepID=UPI00136652A4|nr:ABC-2 family transporter protein [Paenibacillus sp. MMS18-CY102]MWC27598.1 ABC transporter permease [Paenibacillus sp. MMS18-CY102]